MNRLMHPDKDLLVLVGVLGLPLLAATLGLTTALGLLAPDDVVLSISAVVAIALFMLAVLLAHIFHRGLS